MSTQSDSTISRSGTPASEEQLVRAVLDRVYAAWEANDADAFVEAYADEATAQLPGASLPNRAAIHATMTTVFAGELKGTRAVHEPRSVRFLGDDVAVVISQSAIVFPGQSEPAEPLWYIVWPRTPAGSALSTTTLRERFATSPR